jgi:hypothetical protein
MKYKHLPCCLMKFALSQRDLLEPTQMWTAKPSAAKGA